MSPTIIECEQGSKEWFRARMGIPTASEFATVLMSGRSGGLSEVRAKYMRKLAFEIDSGELDPSGYTNANMERGKEMEAEARLHYEISQGLECRRVGFIRNGQKGCSPDSLIGDNGMLEIKTAFPHILIALMQQNKFPPEHKAQCQGGLWVAEREWIDLKVYWPRCREFVKRAYRDEDYIKKLASAVDTFNEELAALVEFIRRYEPGPRELAA